MFSLKAERPPVAAPALHSVGDEVVRHAWLHLPGLHHGEDAFNKVHPPFGSCAARQLALDNAAPQRPLCGIVGRWQQRVEQKRPQRTPHLDHVRACIGRAAALRLCATQFQLNPHALL